MLMIAPVISVIATNNQPPNKPTITGPTKGKPDVELEYIFMTTDPEEDNIFFHISWGCCGQGDFHSYGPYESGREVKLSHSYSEEDDYIIQAYAEDTNGGESDIAALEISIPKKKAITNQGLFEAELGRRGNDEILISLDGTYQARGRFIVVGGTASSWDKEGRFRGGFRGNHIVIKLPIRSRPVTIFGRCSFDEDRYSFQGLWLGRGIPIRGWITGTLTPTN